MSESLEGFVRINKILIIFYSDNSILRKSQPDPSKLAFKDRHKLFEGQTNAAVKAKPKMSKKLLELEEQFGSQWNTTIYYSSTKQYHRIHAHTQLHTYTDTLDMSTPNTLLNIPHTPESSFEHTSHSIKNLSS